MYVDYIRPTTARSPSLVYIQQQRHDPLQNFSCMKAHPVAAVQENIICGNMLMTNSNAPGHGRWTCIHVLKCRPEINSIQMPPAQASSCFACCVGALECTQQLKHIMCVCLYVWFPRTCCCRTCLMLRSCTSCSRAASCPAVFCARSWRKQDRACASMNRRSIGGMLCHAQHMAVSSCLLTCCQAKSVQRLQPCTGEGNRRLHGAHSSQSCSVSVRTLCLFR